MLRLRISIEAALVAGKQRSEAMTAARQILLGLALLAGYLAATVLSIVCDALDTIDARKGGHD